jgi:Flp pilus assembly protein TadG
MSITKSTTENTEGTEKDLKNSEGSVLSVSSVVLKPVPHRLTALLRGHDKGTVAITFMIALPILLTIIAIFVQYALIVNAQLVVDRAVQSAARTAVTALPTNPDVDNVDGPALIRRSALLALSPISPLARDDASPDGTALANAWQTLGASESNDSGLARRYTYAAAGATVTWQRLDDSGSPIAGDDWQPTDYAHSRGQRIRITITYPFLLTVPAVNRLIGGNAQIAGVSGRVLTLSATTDVQLSHGREAQTDTNGWPQ